MPLSDDIAQETSHMDRITQLQDATDQLIRIMFNSIDYLTKKATFKQVNPDFPITQTIPGSEDPQIFDERKRQLAEQLLYKAKQIETLIALLPSASDLKPRSQTDDSANPNGEGLEKDEADVLAGDNDKELQELEVELQEVNAEYLQVLDTADELYAQVQQTIRSMLDEHHELSSALLQQ